ncbi:MAG: DNA alkylation repair protein [Planctomycetota bacterium]
MDLFLKEVHSRLCSYAKQQPLIKSEEPITRLKLPVPIVRKAVKKPCAYSFVSQSEMTVVQIWDYIWKHTPYFEVMSQSLYFYQGKTLLQEEFDLIQTWIERCTCWEHSDDLSKIYAQVFEENPQWLLPLYKKWNHSRCRWKRRQSIVGLLEYASKRKKVLPFEDLICFVDALLADEEYYVQKGIGWTLREIYNVYPEQTLKYFEENLSKISPIAYSAATEKLEKATKKKLKEQRKQQRKQT